MAKVQMNKVINDVILTIVEVDIKTYTDKQEKQDD